MLAICKAYVKLLISFYYKIADNSIPIRIFQVIGFPLGVILQSISTFVIGIVVAFHYSYKLSLVCLAAVPLSLLTVLIEAKHMSKTAIVEKESTEMGTKIATEAITNIRTVASLSM